MNLRNNYLGDFGEKLQEAEKWVSSAENAGLFQRVNSDGLQKRKPSEGINDANEIVADASVDESYTNI
jgi:hypothetical protein